MMIEIWYVLQLNPESPGLNQILLCLFFVMAASEHGAGFPSSPLQNPDGRASQISAYFQALMLNIG